MMMMMMVMMLVMMMMMICCNEFRMLFVGKPKIGFVAAGVVEQFARYLWEI